MDCFEFDKYNSETKKKWGNSEAYIEHAEKTKDYSKDKWNKLAQEMNDIFVEFSNSMKNGLNPASNEVQHLVEVLQNHITHNYYNCTNDILYGLGQMYVADERFKSNIDNSGEGTALFVMAAIEVYCSK